MARVLSCRFLRLSCSDEDHPLFRREYARYLLRCFPHCCPEHAPRCYCGCSVHLLVTFSTSVSAVPLDNLLVCARFEPSRVVPLWPINLTDAGGESDEDTPNQEHERKLEPGETVSLPASLLSAGHTPSKDMIWVRADMEGDVKQRTLPKHQQHRDAVVLARHASPGFTLVSYRRAGNANHADRALPALDEPADSDIAMDVDAPEIVLPPASGLDNTPAYSDVFASMRRHNDNGNSEEDDASATITIDAIFWQQEIRARESGLVEKGQHLFILWRFLRCVSLKDVGLSADTVESHVRPHWLLAAAALRNPSASAIVQLEEVMVSFLTNVFSNALTVQTAASSVTGRNANQLPARDLAVIQASTQLLLHAIASPVIQYLLRSAFELDNHDINTLRLHERFAALVSDLYNAVSELLLLVSPSFGSAGDRISLPELVDEVLSLIYSQRRFAALRLEVSALLMSQQTAGPLSGALNHLFRAFTAQARETVIAAGSRQQGAIQRPVAWPGDADAVRSPWSRRWLLEPGSIQVDPIVTATQDQESGFELSVVSLTRWLHEFACIDIAVRDDATCCSVRSVISLASEARPMELVLDGRLRVFRAMPSGLSSMVGATGGWAIGDYSATWSDGAQSLERLRCFPHCCSEHAPRSYGGCSIHVLVTFSADMTTVDHDDLVVCARFEPSRVVPLWPIRLADAIGASEEASNQENERKLQPGETVLLPVSLLSTGRQPRTEAVWIRADKEGEAKQRALPKVQTPNPPRFETKYPLQVGDTTHYVVNMYALVLIDLSKNSILFVLNNHRFPKWFYMYDSSITRTQREMTHHLAVYVCQLSSDGPQASSEQRDAVVLARHASPGFTLVSYRRAGNAGNPGCALLALTAADDNLQHSSEQLPLPSDVMDSYSTVILAPQPSSSNAQQLEWRLDTAPESVAVVHPMGAMNSLHRREGVVNDDTDGDAMYWQHDARARESRLTEKGTHLLILWRFLACVSVTDLGVDFGLQQKHIQTHWLRAAAALRAPSTSANLHLETVMSSFLDGLWRNPPTDSSEQLPDRNRSVIQASADLFLRAFTSRAVQQLLHSALTPEGNEINKPQLRKRFVTLVSELHGVLDTLLHVVPPAFSVVAPGNDASCCSIWSVLSLVGEMAPKELVLDGRLRVFRVMPSGLSSVVAVAGQWAVGDYVANFSDDTQSLEMTFYAFSEGDSAISGRDGSGRDTTAVRQARVTFVLQQELNAGDLSASVDPRDLFIFVDAVVAGAAYVAGDQDTIPKLAEMPSAARLAVLRELLWAPMLEMKAGYIAVSVG
ncbi:hypothetical protein BBJ28_00008257 [Nothophytophthora sp. Chile5]|nr:hypothetical protein BBJ28_00008257 [Nothophytophthora sp. Chile5]